MPNITINIPWSEWELVEQIGRGQFGTVYKISSTKNGMTEYAAMKVISIPNDPLIIENDFNYGYDRASVAAKYKSYLDDVIKEYQLMMKIKGSPNIVRCDDISISAHEDGISWDVYIRMECLMPILKALPNITDEKTVVKLGIDICGALDVCEKNNIIHRDIKPSNILMNEYGVIKLGDFGVSRTLEGENTFGTKGIGTYDYMAPEIYNGGKYGKEADIYSLGMVMYWMLNNRTFPFLINGRAPTLQEISSARQKRFNGESFPRPINGNDALISVVLKACAFNPNDRYRTANEMLADLNRLVFDSNVNSSYSDSHDSVVIPSSKPTKNEMWNDSQETVGKNYSVENNYRSESSTIGKESVAPEVKSTTVNGEYSYSYKKSTNSSYSSSETSKNQHSYTSPKNVRPRGVSNYTFPRSPGWYQVKKKDILKNGYGITEAFIEINNDELLVYKKVTYFVFLIILFYFRTIPKLKFKISRNQIKSIQKISKFNRDWIVFELIDGRSIAVASTGEVLSLIDDWFYKTDNSSLICSNCNNWISSGVVYCPYCKSGIISNNRVVDTKPNGNRDVIFYGHSIATAKAQINKQGFITKNLYNGDCNLKTENGSLFIYKSNGNVSTNEPMIISKKDVNKISFQPRNNEVVLSIILNDKIELIINATRKTLIYLYAFLNPK